MKLLPLLTLLLLVGCKTSAPVAPGPVPLDTNQNTIINPATPAENAAWPRRGWN